MRHGKQNGHILRNTGKTCHVEVLEKKMEKLFGAEKAPPLPAFCMNDVTL